MNIKKLLLSGLAVFITFMILDFVVHNLILGETYRALSNVWRPDMMSLMWVMYISGAIFSVLFAYIFSRGYEDEGIVEGLRFGLIVGIFTLGVGVLNQFVVYPLPFSLVVKWFVLGMIEFLAAGAVVSVVYKKV